MQQAERDMWRDLALIIGVPFVVLIAVGAWAYRKWIWVPEYHPPRGVSVFRVAAGKWDWTTKRRWCADSDPEFIAFSPDTSVMTIAYGKPWKDSTGRVHAASVYDLSMHTDNRIRGQIRGESRLTDTGTPVVWDLVLTSPDSYVWERTDLAPWDHSALIRRCPSAGAAWTADPDAK